MFNLSRLRCCLCFKWTDLYFIFEIQQNNSVLCTEWKQISDEIFATNESILTAPISANRLYNIRIQKIHFLLWLLLYGTKRSLWLPWRTQRCCVVVIKYVSEAQFRGTTIGYLNGFIMFVDDVYIPHSLNFLSLGNHNSYELKKKNEIRLKRHYPEYQTRNRVQIVAHSLSTNTKWQMRKTSCVSLL